MLLKGSCLLSWDLFSFIKTKITTLTITFSILNHFPVGIFINSITVPSSDSISMNWNYQRSSFHTFLILFRRFSNLFQRSPTCLENFQRSLFTKIRKDSSNTQKWKHTIGTSLRCLNVSYIWQWYSKASLSYGWQQSFAIHQLAFRGISTKDLLYLRVMLACEVIYHLGGTMYCTHEIELFCILY